jgi:hypothetical protein
MAVFEHQEDPLTGIISQSDWKDAVNRILSLDEHLLEGILTDLYPGQVWFSIQHQRLAVLGYYLEVTHQATQFELIFAIALIHHKSDIEATFIPQQLVYLRSNGERLDPFNHYDSFHELQLRIVREQRIEPHQFGSWSIKIFQEYIHGWKLRNPNVKLDCDVLFRLAQYSAE